VNEIESSVKGEASKPGVEVHYGPRSSTYDRAIRVRATWRVNPSDMVLAFSMKVGLEDSLFHAIVGALVVFVDNWL
jgi:hypothetical protein